MLIKKANMWNAPRTERQILSAKRAQLDRFGGNVPGYRKKCRRGKSCGAARIPSQYYCMVDLPMVLNPMMNALTAEVMARRRGVRPAPAPGNKVAAAHKKVVKSASKKKKDVGVVARQSADAPRTKEKTTGRHITGEKDIVGVLSAISPGEKVIDVDGGKPAAKVNWKAGIGQGAEFKGRGSFGAFVEIPAKNLAKGMGKSYPGGVGVKYGKISDREVEVLSKVGKLGVGPKLIAARLDPTTLPNKIAGATVRLGAVAMGVVPGQQLNNMKETPETKAAYVKALKKLHLAGVAHGDAAGRNSMFHNGKVRFVDFGLAQVSYKAALAEAIGAVTGSTHTFIGYPPNKLKENFNKGVEPLLKKQGFSDWEISEIKAAGIRNSDSFYTRGAFGKMTDDQAKMLLTVFYKGI